MQQFTPVTLFVTLTITAILIFMLVGPAKVWQKILTVGVVSFIANGVKSLFTKKS